AMIVTSLLRGRLNRILWRAIHLLAYASWPVAFAHSIGSSKDLQQGWMLGLAVGCAMIVAAAAIWRLAHAARQVPRARRVAAVFPAHRKLAAVARAGVRQGRTVVVANGAESEPASRKDELLLQLAPNLVLDGLQLTAEAVGAAEAHLYLHHAPGPQILRALAERAARGLDRLAVSITQAPPRFLAGQEAAVVNRIGGGPALPTFQPPRVSERGLGGAPTLVQNVETLAHLALIARYGPRWFRAVGTAAEPGSMLTTIYRPDGKARVHEVAIGAPLSTLLG